MDWQQITLIYDALNKLSRMGNWDQLEDHFFQLSRRLAGNNISILIKSLNLTEYEASLRSLLQEGYKKASQTKTKAIYFEYDMDNLWKGNLFIHQTYNDESAQDDDWACEWIEIIDGPINHNFANIYNRYGGFEVESIQKIGTTFYLISRTVAAFGRAVNTLPLTSFPVCVGHHDQHIVTRIKEV
jgi:hypothetical protein